MGQESVFDPQASTGSLFETVAPTKEAIEAEKTEELSRTSLFAIDDNIPSDDDDDDDDDKKSKDEEDLDEDGNPKQKAPETPKEPEEPVEPAGAPYEPSAEVTPYGQAIQSLIKTGEFLIPEDEDETRDNHTEDELVQLVSLNIAERSLKLAEESLVQILDNLSPTAQKLVTGELKGVKIAEVIQDIAEYQEIEELPESPTDEQREKIVRAYYKKQAKEKNKDADWVAKQVEKTIDREELDEVYEEAKEFFSEEIDKKIQAKEEEKRQKAYEKENFKKYHSHYVNKMLNAENLFGIQLTKEEKEPIASVLTSFIIRPTDQKEKLGITALIDQLIHSKNPDETYKVLGLMALAATAPDKLIQKLRSSQEKAVVKENVVRLKTANVKGTNVNIAKQEQKKQVQARPGTSVLR